MYFTCGSIASWSSVGRGVEALPPRPGPATRDIVLAGIKQVKAVLWSGLKEQ
jgi:hypothetical protein